MRMMDVDKLNPHPKNRYFFDDIDGEPWVAFLESIKTSGVIEPIIVSAPDLTIVSGHQRVRACKKLGIKQVAVEERSYESEDEILKQLIETNIRQRGVGNTNAVKLGRCIKELERIYGVRNGSANEKGDNRIGEGTKFRDQKTQEDLAEELDMSTKQLRKYKSLTDLIPELQDAVQSGQITATTAMGFVKKLSPEEQKKLAESISGQHKVSGKEVEKYVAEIRRLGNENEQLHRDNRNLSRQLKEMEEPKVIEKTIEVAVIPDDYEETKKQLQMYRGDNERLNRENKEKVAELSKANELLRELQAPDGEKKVVQSAQESMDNFSIATYDYIRRYGGNVWSFDKWADVPESTRKNFAKAIQMLSAFAQQMADNVGGLE